MDSVENAMIFAAIGFLILYLLERITLIHVGHESGVVILHDFSDGIGTVSVLLANNASRRTAFRWLVVDALAPVAGVLAAFAIYRRRCSRRVTGPLHGFFLYVAGAELLPEAHRKESGWMVFAATLVGATLIFGVTQVISI